MNIATVKNLWRVIYTEEFFKKLTFYSLCVLWASLTFSPALMEISFGVSLGGWILYRFKKRDFQYRYFSKLMAISLFVFMLLTTASLFWSEYPSPSFRGVFKVLQQLAVFGIVVDIFADEKDVKKFQKIYLGVLVVVVVNAFYQYFAGKDFIRGFPSVDASAGVRLTGSFGRYTHLASYLVTTIPLLAMLTWVNVKSPSKIWVKLFYCLLLIGSLVILFMTRSRGPFLAFFLGCIFFLILKRQFLVLGITALIGISALFVLPKGMIIHLDAEGQEQSIVERYYLWKRALDVIEAKPLTGTGINTYSAAHAKYDKTQNWRVRDYYAHNGYLQLAAETGLPTLFFFLSFLAAYFYQTLRVYFHQRDGAYSDYFLGILIGVFNFLVTSAVDTVLHNSLPVLVFWFMLALGWVYSRSLSRNQS